MGLRFRPIQVKRVVRGYKGDAVGFAEAQQRVVHNVFLREPVAVQFGIKAVSEYFFVPQKSFFGLLETHVQNQMGNFPRQSACQCHHSFRILGQKGFVDARHIVKSFDKPGTAQAS